MDTHEPQLGLTNALVTQIHTTNPNQGEPSEVETRAPHPDRHRPGSPQPGRQGLRHHGAGRHRPGRRALRSVRRRQEERFLLARHAAPSSDELWLGARSGLRGGVTVIVVCDGFGWRGVGVVAVFVGREFNFFLSIFFCVLCLLVYCVRLRLPPVCVHQLFRYEEKRGSTFRDHRCFGLDEVSLLVRQK